MTLPKLNKLSQKQEQVLKHLVMRNHAMTPGSLRTELQLAHLYLGTFTSLRNRGYIRLTDQGWLATDAGRLRVL